MPTITTSLNDGFDVRIEYTPTFDGYIEDITIISATTGECVNELLDDNSVAWKQAWSAAERHMLSLPVTPKVRRAIAADVAAMCADTPYGVAA